MFLPSWQRPSIDLGTNTRGTLVAAWERVRLHIDFLRCHGDLFFPTVVYWLFPEELRQSFQLPVDYARFNM